MIKSNNDDNAALLVIDIQEECTGPEAKPEYSYSGVDQFIANTNAYIERAYNRGDLVVYVKHVDYRLLKMLISKVFFWTTIKESPGLKIDSRIKRVSSHIIPKSRQSAFSNPELDTLLKENKIKKVELLGLDAAYCVQATAFHGLDRNYDVTIFTDAVVTDNFDRWEQLKNKLSKQGAALKALLS